MPQLVLFMFTPYHRLRGLGAPKRTPRLSAFDLRHCVDESLREPQARQGSGDSSFWRNALCEMPPSLRFKHPAQQLHILGDLAVGL